MELYTMGHGRWPTKQRLATMIQVLQTAEVSTVVDIRHSPCSSSLAFNSDEKIPLLAIPQPLAQASSGDDWEGEEQ